jgi:hypothetical protein
MSNPDRHFQANPVPSSAGYFVNPPLSQEGTHIKLAGRLERVSQLADVHLRAARYGGQPSMTLAGRGLPTVAASEASAWRRLAEGEGFEPPVPFRVQWFSRPPPSTTRPSLRVEKLAGNRAILVLLISRHTARRAAPLWAKWREVHVGQNLQTGAVSLHVSPSPARTPA